VNFILWYLDAVAGADQLLRELGRQPAFANETADVGQDAPTAN
jgi:hypothetical protein